jgi:hypothetical protein
LLILQLPLRLLEKERQEPGPEGPVIFGLFQRSEDPCSLRGADLQLKY